MKYLSIAIFLASVFMNPAYGQDTNQNIPLQIEQLQRPGNSEIQRQYVYPAQDPFPAYIVPNTQPPIFGIVDAEGNIVEVRSIAAGMSITKDLVPEGGRVVPLKFDSSLLNAAGWAQPTGYFDDKIEVVKTQIVNAVNQTIADFCDLKARPQEVNIEVSAGIKAGVSGTMVVKAKFVTEEMCSR